MVCFGVSEQEDRMPLRFADIAEKPTLILDLTSVTGDEFAQVLPAFEAAFQAHMHDWTMTGTPRTARQFTVYTNCPLPTAADRLLFTLSYLKNAPTQPYHGATFGLIQSSVSTWLNILIPVLRTALETLGDAPTRTLAALHQRLGVPAPVAAAPLPCTGRCRMNPDRRTEFDPPLRPPTLAQAALAGEAMIRSQTVHTIRDLLAQGQSIRAIADQTGLARNTIRKYLRGTPEAAPRPRRTSKLDPFKDQIRRWVQEDRLLNCVTMLDRLQHQGYTGSSSILKAFVTPLRPPRRSQRPVQRYETAPGEQFQFDWGEFVFEQDGRIQKLYGFTAVLGYSRMRFVCFTKRCDVAPLIRSTMAACAYFEGLPQRMLTDRDEERPARNGWHHTGLAPGLERFSCRAWGDPTGLPPVCTANQGQGRAHHSRGQRELLAGRALYGPRRPEPAGPGLV